MADYNLSRLQSLFSQAFTAEELKILCYDRPEYKAVYNQITAGSGFAGKGGASNWIGSYSWAGGWSSPAGRGQARPPSCCTWPGL